MTKKDIVKQISERANLTQLQTKEIVQWTFDAIIETLEKEGRIELRNFGVFAVKTRKARTARNPLTNEEVVVEAKNVVTFQPGKIMEERVKKANVKTPAKKKIRSKQTTVPAHTPSDSQSPTQQSDHDCYSTNSTIVDDDYPEGPLPTKPR